MGCVNFYYWIEGLALGLGSWAQKGNRMWYFCGYLVF